MRRDVGSIFALKVNNFFLFLALLAWGNFRADQPPRSAYAFLLLMGLLLVFPLSSDPLSKVPASRLALWPIDGGTRAALRIASIAMSPLFWLAAVLFLRASLALAVAFVGLIVGIHAAQAAARRLPRGQGHGFRIPALPGKFGILITAAWRQIFSTLDAYLAVLLAAAGWVYRFGFASPDPAAYPIFSMLAALALSTVAQCLFGLDSPAAWTRYRLLPLSFRAITLTKDIALLSLVVLLTLPLNAIAGSTFIITALAIGHLGAAKRVDSMARWRFASGSAFLAGLQLTAGVALALAAVKRTPAFALVSITLSILGTNLPVALRE